jgi:hypothetical protein
MGEGASSHEVPSFSLFDRKKGVGFFKFMSAAPGFSYGEKVLC